MKILDFVAYYPPHIGGLEKYAKELHENLIKSGHEITVFTPNIPLSKEVEQNGTLTIIRFPAIEIVHNFPFPKIWSPKFWSFYAGLYKKDYDCVFSVTRFFTSCLLAFFYSKIKRRKWIHIEHGSDFVKSDSRFITLAAILYDKTLGRLVLTTSNLNIAPSQSAANFIHKFDKRKTPVIYRGMPFEDINKISPNINLKNQYPNKIILFYAGRFINGKGLNDLLDAIKKIDGDFILLLAGYGPEETNLKNKIARLNIQDKVQFLGSKSFEEIISILKITDIFINPSYNEGLPTTVLEAGTCGCAIVATDVGGTREIVKHNHSALLLTPKDIDTLSNYINLLLKDPEKRRSLGEAAQKEIRKKFNWETSINSYIREINAIQ